jgi:rifampicin phosphotransferase
VVLQETATPGVVTLADADATDPDVVGSKAAALAVATRAGLPVLPGFVVTTQGPHDAAGLETQARRHWDDLSEHGTRPLVVRSSSPVEDTLESSMAGRFESVVGVQGWDDFVAAVAAVLESAVTVAEELGGEQKIPMAVLVQPLLEPKAGGVLFGVDPVTGRADRRVIAVVSGGPDALVSGAVSGARFELDESGHVVDSTPATDDPIQVSKHDLRRVKELGDRAAAVFGGPQDVEWAMEEDGTRWLLQSRPVTTEVAGLPQGPVLGPGPVAETFPDPLSRLEQDLWIQPLRRAICEVFRILGVVRPAVLARSPLVVVVDGRVAVDLDLFESGGKARWYQVIARSRAVRTAWRVGRLRTALPGIGTDVVAHADDTLLDVPHPSTLTDRQLIATLERAGDALVSLHTYEMLVGMVLDPHASQLTGASVALRVLALARREGVPEEDIVREHPTVLALVPPRVGSAPELPADVAAPDWAASPEDRASVVREALRLRVRWMQELEARYAWELGTRLVEHGVLDHADQVRCLDLSSLELVVRDLAVPVRDRLDECIPSHDPLPARFRLSDRGRPIPVLDRHPHQGTGAGGGRKRGTVFVGEPADAPDGSVLVVSTLDSRIAPVLPRLRGLVAETGSVLAHLAILAREAGVATVVGLSGATSCLENGTVVDVDGASGSVTVVEPGSES